MSIKRHIAILNSHLSHWQRLLENKICDIDEGKSTIEALKMAIELLESEPCNDCISREDAVYVANGYCHPQNIADELRKLPSVVPQPRTGRWINEGRKIRCNKCKIGYTTVKGMRSVLTYNFCPHCGARMIKSQEGDKK